MNIAAPFPIPPFAPQKKEIVYPPPPAALVEAVRAELRRLIEAPDLDANLGMISRVADKADELFMMVKSPEAIMRDENAITLPGTPGAPANAETYGAALLRQVVPALQGYYQAQRETPEALVYSIAAARKAGMVDVAAELEKKLCGKALDGDRPIAGGVESVTVKDYLEAATPVTSGSVEGIRQEGEVQKATVKNETGGAS